MATESPCASSPSACASVSAAGPIAARLAASQRTSEVRVMKSSTPSPEEKRALRHPIGKVGIVGDEYRLRGGIVLGLRQKVGGDPGRIVAAVGNDQDLGGAGDQVDADLAEDAALGGGDIGVAGSDDLVDRRDRRGSVGERGHRLGAADAVDLVD